MQFRKLLIVMLALCVSTSTFAYSSGFLSGSDSADTPISNLDKNSLGLGLAYVQSQYMGVENKMVAFPLINYSYNQFFWRGFSGGYHVYQTKAMAASVILKPEFNGYEESDSGRLDNLSEKKYMVGAGGQLTYKIKPLNLNFFAVHDVTGRTDGNEGGVKVNTGLPLKDGRLILVPSISFVWQDSDITNYYYGVSSDNETQNRSAYHADSTVNTILGLTGIYRVSSNWNARLSYNYTKYGSEISDSSIVEHDAISTIVVGMTYVFD